MRRSIFSPFPTGRGPVKLLVYGEPGTMKTRRSLQMPGPLYMIDLECGAADYGDLVDPEKSFYLRTKSHLDVAQAIEELLSKPSGVVGTLIIDPITQVWQSLQNAHVSRTCIRKNRIPEDVFFDVGTWGKLKRSYSDIMAALLSAPFHVVMTARGKEKIDERGNSLGYGYEGEKSTMFLANVVIESHSNGDVVVKDRTGTYTEKQRLKRVDFTDFLPKEGMRAHVVESDSAAAFRDGQRQEELARQHPEWRSGGGKERFLAAISELDLEYKSIKKFCHQNNRPEPALMPPEQRHRLIQFLQNPANRKILKAS